MAPVTVICNTCISPLSIAFPFFELPSLGTCFRVPAHVVFPYSWSFVCFCDVRINKMILALFCGREKIARVVDKKTENHLFPAAFGMFFCGAVVQSFCPPC